MAALGSTDIIVNLGLGIFIVDLQVNLRDLFSFIFSTKILVFRVTLFQVEWIFLCVRGDITRNWCGLLSVKGTSTFTITQHIYVIVRNFWSTKVFWVGTMEGWHMHGSTMALGQVGTWHTRLWGMSQIGELGMHGIVPLAGLLLVWAY